MIPGGRPPFGTLLVWSRSLRDLLREPRALLATLALPLVLYPLLLLLGGFLLGQPTPTHASLRIGLCPQLTHLEPWLAGEGLKVVALDQSPHADLAAGLCDGVLEPEPARTGVRLLFKGSEALRGRVEAALGQWHQARLLEANQARRDLLLTERALLLEHPPGLGLFAFLPVVLLLVVLSGTAFAALDLFAGDRERGSLETLLAQPLTPRQVVLGLFFTTLVAGLAALALNLGSLVTLAPLLPGQAELPSLRWPGAGRLFLLAAPLACSLTALLCWVMALARSFREGQAYLLPLTLGCLIPASMGLSPALPLDSLTALLPIAGPILVLRESLAGWPTPGPILAMTAASLAWGAVALLATTRLMASDTGRLAEDPLASLDHPQGPPGRRAILWTCVLLFAFLVLAPVLQEQLGALGQPTALVVLILCPALILPRLLGLPRERAFPLQRPTLPGVGATLLVAAGSALFGIHLLALQRLWLPLPEAVLADLEHALPGVASANLGLLLLASALLPGLCEETLFRGPLLGAFRSHWGVGRGVLLSALFFAAMHVSVFRFLATFSAGLFFGLLLLATRSLPLTCLCHAAYNALVLTAATGFWPAWAGPLLPGDTPSLSLALAGLGVLIALLGVALATRFGRRGAAVRLGVKPGP